MIKLLIVDDSALMRRHLTQLFESEGDFRHARNGNEAVQMNRDFQPDVVTLDINMPEIESWRCRLRSETRRYYIHVTG